MRIGQNGIIKVSREKLEKVRWRGEKARRLGSIWTRQPIWRQWFLPTQPLAISASAMLATEMDEAEKESNAFQQEPLSEEGR